MNDKECVLCEFTNEENSIAVGYHEWLLTSVDDKKLDEIIGNQGEVKIQWPNVNIRPASTMKTRVKKCTWQTVVAKILASGDWKTVCGMRDNLEKYSMLNPSKEDRKIINRKSTESNSNKNLTKSVNQSCVPQTVQSNKENKNVTKSVPSRKAGPSTKGMKLFQACKLNKNFQVLSDSSCDDEDPDKNELQQKISCLQEENKQLKSIDKKRKRTVETLMNDLTLAAALSMKLRENLETIADISSKNTKLLSTKQGTIQSKNDLKQLTLKETCESPEDNEKYVPKTIKTPDSLNYHFDVDHRYDVSPDTPEKIQNVADKIAKDKQLKKDDSVELKSVIKNNNERNKNVSQQKTQNQNREESAKREVDISSSQNFSEKYPPEVIDGKGAKVNVSGAAEEALQNLGDTDIKVNSKKLLNCNHLTASKLTTDLLTLLFTKQELATSSITGKVANIHLGKGTSAKMQLDTTKIAAIKSYVTNKFPTTEKLQSIINKAIQQKCCNAAKCLKFTSRTDDEAVPKE